MVLEMPVQIELSPDLQSEIDRQTAALTSLIDERLAEYGEHMRQNDRAMKALEAMVSNPNSTVYLHRHRRGYGVSWEVEEDDDMTGWESTVFHPTLPAAVLAAYAALVEAGELPPLSGAESA